VGETTKRSIEENIRKTFIVAASNPRCGFAMASIQSKSVMHFSPLKVGRVLRAVARTANGVEDG